MSAIRAGPLVVKVFLCAVLALAACEGPRKGLGAPREQPTDNPAVAESIRAVVDGKRPLARRPHDVVAVRNSLRGFYSPAMAPGWTAGGRPGPGAEHAAALLAGAGGAGLDPEDYDAAWLERRRSELTEADAPDAEALAGFDVALTTQLLRFLSAVHGGRVVPGQVGFNYHVEDATLDLGERLRRTTTMDGLDRLVAALEPRFAQYPRLKLALARYRDLAREGSAPAGRVRQIELALERLRWLPHAPAGRLLVANVPAFRLVAFREASDPRPALQMGIVVGRAARTQTPLFTGELRQVIFRPAWHPPVSIVRNEILPALRRDPGYLKRQRMELVGASDGRALPPTAENLARLRAGRLALRQRPGGQNALGLVKFVFPNDHRVYMHGTPAQALFARARRDFSHGCIRVEEPAALAEFVLSQQPGWSRERIEAAMNGPRSLGVDVVAPIPVMIFYTTAIVRADGTVEFFDDVYGLDARLDRALKERSRTGPSR